MYASLGGFLDVTFPPPPRRGFDFFDKKPKKKTNNGHVGCLIDVPVSSCVFLAPYVVLTCRPSPVARRRPLKKTLAEDHDERQRLT